MVGGRDKESINTPNGMESGAENKTTTYHPPSL